MLYNNNIKIYRKMNNNCRNKSNRIKKISRLLKMFRNLQNNQIYNFKKTNNKYRNQKNKIKINYNNQNNRK